MKSQQILPPEDLKSYIRYFWTLESNASDLSPKTFLTLADGFPGLIFQQSGSSYSLQDGKTLPHLYVYGQTTQCTAIQAPSRFSIIGIYFYPHAIKSVFGVDAGEITDDCLELDLIYNKHFLLDQLQHLASTSQQIHFLSGYVRKLIEKNNLFAEPVLHHAINRMIEAQGNVNLTELRNEINMTERTMERRFQNLVGMSPKLFCRIRRFQSSLDQLRNRSFRNLSDIAFDQAYADQSHFIRVFREFAGYTPARFTKKTNELIENFPELIL